MSTPALPIVDAGAPFEHGDEPVQGKAPAPVAPDSLEARLGQLEKDLATERARSKEHEDTAKYWAERAKNTALSPLPEPEPEPEPELPAVEDDSPEKLLDDLSREGMAALTKRGLVTQAEVNRRVKEARDSALVEVNETNRESIVERQFIEEFPEIVADLDRLRNGQQPQSELWALTQKHFKAAVALDPSLADKKSPLVMAARQARAELALKGGKGRVPQDTEPEPTRGAVRRARIQSQAPEPTRGRSLEDDLDAPVMSDDAKTVMSKLGVTEAEFTKNATDTRGGRRGR